MRKLFIRLTSFAIICLPLICSGQVLTVDKVNSKAVSAFTASVPGITPQWKKGPKGGFEAWFSQESVQKIFVYDAEGSLKIKKSAAKITEFPASVTTSLNGAYGSPDVKSAYKVVTSDKQKYFEICVAQAAGNDLWRFTPEGVLIGKKIATIGEATGGPVSEPVAAKTTPVIADAAKPVEAPVTTAPVVEPAPKKVEISSDPLPEPEFEDELFEEVIIEFDGMMQDEDMPDLDDLDPIEDEDTELLRDLDADGGLN